MCDFCHHSPHLCGCPEAPEPIHIFICSECGESIYEGESYYDVMGEQFCEECMRGFLRTAELYDTYDDVFDEQIELEDINE